MSELNYLNPSARDKSEYILCAAIWYKDGVKYDNQPTNISTGIVIAGRRHHNCIYTHWILTGKSKSMMSPEDRPTDGFLTSKNRFVDRYEGAAIAYAAGQQSDAIGPMFSEDLY